jgi:DUF1009 family protein
MNTPSIDSLTSPIGLIAGNGTFPFEFATNARARGLEVVAVAHVGETDPELEKIVKSCTWIKVGEVGRLIKVFNKAGVRQAAFAGGITKVRLFGGIKLDLRGIKVLSRVRSTNDDSILRGVAAEIESSGVSIVAASVLLEKSLPAGGVLTHRRPLGAELKDGIQGWIAAREIGRLDIGQAVVVVRGAVAAVEAIEGTDAMIARAHQLAGNGGVLVKICKPDQDLRFDLPTIGLKTIENANRSGITAIFIEAGRTLMLDPDGVVRAANRAGIAIVAAGSLEELQAISPSS